MAINVRQRDAEADLNLPPGFRFHPTDEELVVHYLCRKAARQSVPVPIIAEVDLYQFDPWQLPEMAMFGNNEWYFFTPRMRKYPNGSRPNRAAGSGYWKATGADKPVIPAGQSKAVGIKKALVFYSGKAPKGSKSNWIMHEYRLAEADRAASKTDGLRLDNWVLCRLYNKKNDWREEVHRSLMRRSNDEDISLAANSDFGNDAFSVAANSDFGNDAFSVAANSDFDNDTFSIAANLHFVAGVRVVEDEEEDWFVDPNPEGLTMEPFQKDDFLSPCFLSDGSFLNY